MMTEFCRLELSCVDKTEADKIARWLLERRLIACAKQIPVSSSFLWQGKIEEAKEILLVMETKKELFSEIEKEVAKLHSYEVFVLQSLPLEAVSAEAQKWLRESLK